MKRNILSRLTALVLVLMMVFSLAACGGDNNGDSQMSGKLPSSKSDASQQGNKDEHPFSTEALDSLANLREYLSSELIAAAFLGWYMEEDFDNLDAVLVDANPALMSAMPFIGEIPDENVIGDAGDLYCIVPRDEDASVTVNRIEWETLGNGTQPVVTEELYSSQSGDPLLVFVNFENTPDETDIVVNIVGSDGATLEWYPYYDAIEACIVAPVNENFAPLIFDFAHIGDPGNSGPDSGWLPPTELGLIGTEWMSDTGWMMQLGAGENNGGGDNGVVMFGPAYGELGFYYDWHSQGVWWMDGDKLCLELYDMDGNYTYCSFSVLISNSGNELYVSAGKGDDRPPFIVDGQYSTVLQLRY